MKTHEDIKISFLYLEIVDVTNKDANFGRLNCPDPQDNLNSNNTTILNLHHCQYLFTGPTKKIARHTTGAQGYYFLTCVDQVT